MKKLAVLLIVVWAGICFAETRNEMITGVRRVVDDPNGEKWTDTVIAGYLNEFIYETSDMYAVAQSETTITTSTGTVAYKVPSNFMHCTGMQYRNDSSDPTLFVQPKGLVRVDPDEMGRTSVNEEITFPEQYCLETDSARYWPVPLAELKFTMYFTVKYSAMTGGSSVFPMPNAYLSLAKDYAAARCLETIGATERADKLFERVTAKCVRLEQVRDWKARKIAELAAVSGGN